MSRPPGPFRPVGIWDDPSQSWIAAPTLDYRLIAWAILDAGGSVDDACVATLRRLNADERRLLDAHIQRGLS